VVSGSEIKTGELNAFVQKFHRDVRDRSRVVESAVADSAEVVLAKAKQKLTGGNPLHVRTGRLRSSVRRGNVQRSGKAYRVEMGTNVFYGRVHEYGAQNPSHIVRPTRSKWLVFNSSWTGGAGGDRIRAVGAHGESQGGKVFRKSVKIKPKPWLEPSFEESRPLVVRILEKAGVKIPAVGKGA